MTLVTCIAAVALRCNFLERNGKQNVSDCGGSQPSCFAIVSRFPTFSDGSERLVLFMISSRRWEEKTEVI